MSPRPAAPKGARTAAHPGGGTPVTALLQIRSLEAWYGPSVALKDVTFTVNEGEVVTLLGRNGAGKTSTLRAIMGLLTARGSVRHQGQELVGMPAHRIAQRGLGFCPEERAVFSALTVQENLRLPPVVADSIFTEAHIYDTFPSLKRRRSAYGGQLSGGEQQMLAIARILRAGNRFLLLDEPSEGLAPVVVDAIHDTLQTLKGMGYTILLVEQNLDFALSLGDRHCAMESGRIVTELRSDQVRDEYEALTERLGV